MKKIISGLAILSMLLVMLASCSVNGTPVSLVGKWMLEGGHGIYMEIKSDDSVTYGGGLVSLETSKITKCTCNEITIETAGVEVTSKYELSGNTLKLTVDDTTTSYTKE